MDLGINKQKQKVRIAAKEKTRRRSLLAREIERNENRDLINKRKLDYDRAVEVHGRLKLALNRLRANH